MRYFLQLASNENKYESVDKFVFDNRKFAVDNEGNARYSGVYFTEHNSQVELNLNCTIAQLAGVCRMLGMATQTGVGQYDEPTHVNFVKGRSEFLYELATETKWKKATTALPAIPPELRRTPQQIRNFCSNTLPPLSELIKARHSA